MKKNNYFKYATGFFVGVALTFIAACGNKGGNNSNQQVIPVTPFQACANCQNINGAVFFSAESVDYTGSIRLNWTFSGQASPVVQSYPYQSNGMTPGTYYGPVAAQGQLSVSQAMNLGYCVVPAGVYSVGTIQAGQWGYGIASGLALQAISGATSMLITFNGQVSSPGYLQDSQASSSTNPVGRMFGNLQIQSINGQQCQQIIGIQ